MGLFRRVKAQIPNYYPSYPRPENTSFSIGKLFENYVMSLFPEPHFRALRTTPQHEDYNGRIIESKLDPDFQFRHNPTGHKFWVECKYRGALCEGKILWSESGQLERYRRFQENHRPEKVFVVIGFGDPPTMPQEMYCIPLDEIRYPGLYPSSILKYQRHVNRPFWYQGGRLF